MYLVTFIRMLKVIVKNLDNEFLNLIVCSFELEMATKAYITPKILKWARESARMTEEIAASKVSVSVDKLDEWEKGEKTTNN